MGQRLYTMIMSRVWRMDDPHNSNSITPTGRAHGTARQDLFWSPGSIAWCLVSLGAGPLLTDPCNLAME
jgi:hypothetical protein